MTGLAQTAKDSTRVARSLTIDEVVVTGTRNETDVRHLPMTISVVNRKVLERRFQPSVLPALTEQVPGLFATSRGIMGYGVSTGAAGGMNVIFKTLLNPGDEVIAFAPYFGEYRAYVSNYDGVLKVVCWC